MWALGWFLLAVACLVQAVVPFTWLSLWPNVERIIEWELLLLGEGLTSLGFFRWFKLSEERSFGLGWRIVLCVGTLLAVGTTASFSQPQPIVLLVVALWALVPPGLATACVVVLGLSKTSNASWPQSLRLLAALIWGWIPFSLSLVFFPQFPALGLSLGLPILLVVYAFLHFRALWQFDSRLQPQQTSTFVVERTRDAILFLASNGTIQGTNPALRTLLDWKESDAAGKELQYFAIDPSTMDRLKPLQDLELSDWEGIVSLKHRSGKGVPVHVVYRRVHNPAREAVGAVLLLHDLQANPATALGLHVDRLTGLSTRRWVLELLETEFHRVRRYPSPFTIFWLRIKGLSDLWAQDGDEAVDTVLERMGAVLKSGLRKTDFMGRLGENDFLVGLPETSLEKALLIQNRLERLFAMANEEGATGVALHVGLVPLDSDCASTQDFLNKAQKACEAHASG